MFYNRGERDKANETDLKEGGGIEMSTTVLSIIRNAPLSPSRFEYTLTNSRCRKLC